MVTQIKIKKTKSKASVYICSWYLTVEWPVFVYTLRAKIARNARVYIPSTIAASSQHEVTYIYIFLLGDDGVV